VLAADKVAVPAADLVKLPDPARIG